MPNASSKKENIHNKKIKNNININEIETTLKKHLQKNIKGDIIGKISSNFYYVNKNSRIEYLAQELTKNDDITSVGVVDENDDVAGIIVKQELFDLLSRPYGRDVYYYKSVDLITKNAESFNFEENIYSVANRLSKELSQKETKYYLLKTGNNKFAGSFSTKDLLIYLSEMSQRDIKFATEIQSRIIEEKSYKNEHCEIFGASKMAKGVGGDFYAIKKYSESNWVIIICDVSGKGVPSALVTAVICGMFSIYDMNKGLKNFISALNMHLFNTFKLEKYATGIFIDFNEKTGDISVYDCGHGYLYLYRKNKLSMLKIKNGNMPIGIMPEMSPLANKFKLHKNDLLLSFTDGIDEQSNPEGLDYDIKNIIPYIKKNLSVGLKEMKDEIFFDVSEFRKTQPQHDDMTMVFLKYL